jgi:PPM family protein phosphatase
MFWRKKNKSHVAEEIYGPKNKGAEPVNINVLIKTDLGNVRTNNEDAASFFRIADETILREKGYLLIVADGMGGHLAGEVASRMAVDIIAENYYRQSNERNIEKILSKAFNAANKEIYEQASANETQKGMGTTATALAVVATKIYYAHAGDSRAYLYKGNKISRITEDHTYVQELVNNGDITLEQAEVHPQRNILTNAMGTKPALRVDTGKCPENFDENARLLICSDGLYDYLTDEELAKVLAVGSLQQAADFLIAEAKNRGGKDNITVILAELSGEKKQINLKSTREMDAPALTRDADIPTGLNTNQYDR